jgi:hypothetical protein
MEGNPHAAKPARLAPLSKTPASKASVENFFKAIPLFSAVSLPEALAYKKRYLFGPLVLRLLVPSSAMAERCGRPD